MIVTGTAYVILPKEKKWDGFRLSDYMITNEEEARESTFQDEEVVKVWVTIKEIAGNE